MSSYILSLQLLKFDLRSIVYTFLASSMLFACGNNNETDNSNSKEEIEHPNVHLSNGTSFLKKQDYDSAVVSFRKAYNFFRTEKDTINISSALNGLGTSFYYRNQLDSALFYYQKSATLFLQQKKHEVALSRALSNIGMVLNASDLDEQALDYYRKSMLLANKNDDINSELPALLNMSVLFAKRAEYDSAIHYAQLVKIKSQDHDILFGVGKATYILATSYLDKGQLNKATTEVLLGIEVFSQTKSPRELTSINFVYAQILLKQQKYSSSLEIVDKVLNDQINEGLKELALKLKADIYQSQSNVEAAFDTYKLFHETFASISKKRNEENLAKQQIQFDTKVKNQEILSLRDQTTIAELKLKQRNTWLVISLLLIISIVCSSYFLIKAIQSRNQKKLIEVENRLLRTQLNPHFLFNAMGAIQQYIYSKEDPMLISDYLGKFSRLTRMILNYSKEEFISLEDELNFLKHYIQLQQIRFELPFDFDLKINSSLKLDELLIPPMLTQPFIENAIEHGFLHKESKGKITLEIYEEKERIHIIVEDNGIGRKQATALKKQTKHRSLATQITLDRLKLFQRKFRKQTQLLITDLFDNNQQAAGTRVQLHLPLIKE